MPTVEKSVKNVLAVPLDEVVNVAENAATVCLVTAKVQMAWVFSNLPHG